MLNKDNVNHPDHYNQGSVECIDAIESATVNKRGLEAIAVGNIIKYLWRYESKNGLEDVKKAKWYLERLIDYLEKEQNLIESRITWITFPFFGKKHR